MKILRRILHSRYACPTLSLVSLDSLMCAHLIRICDVLIYIRACAHNCRCLVLRSDRETLDHKETKEGGEGGKKEEITPRGRKTSTQLRVGKS